MIKENAGRAVHLANDYPLGAVNDKGAVVSHQGHVTHVDFLFLDIQDRFRLGIFIHLKNNQAQCDFQRCGVGHATLLAFLDVIFWLF